MHSVLTDQKELKVTKKSEILTPNYKQMNPTPFYMSTLHSFRKFQINTPHFQFEQYKNKKSNNFMYDHIQMNPTLTQIMIANTFIKSDILTPPLTPPKTVKKNFKFKK